MLPEKACGAGAGAGAGVPLFIFPGAGAGCRHTQEPGSLTDLGLNELQNSD